MDTRRSKRRVGRFERALQIEAGQVVCPRRGIVDIEACWICPEYRGLAEGRSESVICALSEETLASAVWALDHSARGTPVTPR